MYKIKAALIDDGIDSNSNIFGANISYLALQNGLMIPIEIDTTTAMVTHGSICSLIFTFYSNKEDYDLYSLKIIEPSRQKTSITNMLVALDWCLDNDIVLVCMSIGTTQYNDFFEVQQKIDELTSRGVIIIAACSNSNNITFPASAQNVIGVRCDHMGLLNENEFLFMDNDIANINIISSAIYNQLSSIIGFDIPKGNSFAAPYIASLVCGAIAKGYCSYYQILDYLNNKSVNANQIVDFAYIKSSYRAWNKDINVPIIAVVSGGNKILGSICEIFHTMGYYAVGISDHCENDYFYMLDYRTFKEQMRISPLEILECINNAHQPDICIICVTDNFFLEELVTQNKIDALVYMDSSNPTFQNSGILSLKLPAEAAGIVQKIIEVFDNEE
ncbi:S8 family serine peptidase [Paenibacillus sonchi]|uniref:S8 family serine peptidase n=1 Tax=Paenibacillus sonchi TaxID=373687 RepID=UPI001E42C3E6|nr:S8 family serine peptidase [Paenibacillus sonchi]MCE3200484.1 S8 family serine peptidase [Paenibacillus sonchi]